MPFPFPYTVAAVMERNFQFSYTIFTKQWNFTTAKRQWENGNGMMETGHNFSYLLKSDCAVFCVYIALVRCQLPLCGFGELML